ncbi:MAG: leucine-rich repeat domain-containing protein [Clostridia bacterium]|nr:leucine-rich repeat domain-containing protein [Clostridia bacterium]
MKTSKKLLTGIVLVLTLMLCLVFGASALDETGKCGDNVFWTYDSSTEILTISGQGKMWNSDEDGYNYSRPPYHDIDYKYVVIQNGVTAISAYAFSNSQVTTISIPSSVKKIGKCAFYETYALKNVIIPYGVETIGDYAFHYCVSLEKIVLPDSVRSVGIGVFSNCCGVEVYYTGSQEQWNNVSGYESIASGRMNYNYCKNHTNTEARDEITPTCVESGCSAGVFCNICGYRVSGMDFMKPVRHTDALYDGVCDICGDSASDVHSDKEIRYYTRKNDALRYIPEKTGTFKLDIVYSSVNVQTFVYIYDVENQTYLYSDDTWEGDISVDLFAGKTYLIECEYEESQLGYIDIKLRLQHEHANTVYYSETVPTCTKSGYTDGVYCNDCDKWIQGHSEIDSLGHNYDKTVINPGSCTEEYVVHFKCKVCGYEITEFYGLKHNYDDDSVCKDCGYRYVEWEEQFDTTNQIKVRYESTAFEYGTNLVVEKGQNANFVFEERYGKYISYDISFVLNGEKVQPNGNVTVKIPIPTDFSAENCVIYYVDVNGNKTLIPSRYEDGYIVFETDHFSEYVLVDESSAIGGATEPSEPTDPDEPTTEPDEPNEPDTSDCTHMCHKSGFMGFIWKIVQFFWKLFKINPVCECGMAHY